MAEANQYMVGDLARITEQLNRRSVYAPALVVLINDQVPPAARAYVEKILDGEGVFWDLPPLSGEPWTVYAGLTGFFSQVLRLLCKDVDLDVWEGWGRSQWITSDWHPLSRDFGWKVACRPVPGVFFHTPQAPMPDATRYLSSWPHGFLRRDECEHYAPYLHQRLCELAPKIGVTWAADDVEARLEDPSQLSPEHRFDLHNLCADRDDPKVWQFQRGLVLLGAMRRALHLKKDLISVGY